MATAKLPALLRRRGGSDRGSQPHLVASLERGWLLCSGHAAIALMRWCPHCPHLMWQAMTRAQRGRLISLPLAPSLRWTRPKSTTTRSCPSSWHRGACYARRPNHPCYEHTHGSHVCASCRRVNCALSTERMLVQATLPDGVAAAALFSGTVPWASWCTKPAASLTPCNACGQCGQAVQQPTPRQRAQRVHSR